MAGLTAGAVAAVIVVGAYTGATEVDESAPAQTPVDFSRQIRPILSDKCFQCHGPDPNARQANLRLDSLAEATRALETGGAAVIPGDAASSKMIARVTSPDIDFRMPDEDSGKSLSADEIELLRQWIDQGATWEEHWAFIAPKRLEPPAASNPRWPRNGIDNFILANLDAEGLAPTAEADKVTLIRRLTLDLTGLPPTLEEVEAFLADDDDDAYEKVVDRLLASERYGEHQARYWLDAARYGDTHGLHLDNDRSMWPWRDWVINAFNDNMPFDQFTVEQLAGDLLPEPTANQIIATGFNRNNVTTSEGGAINAEYLVKYAADRTETTSTVWMGLTLGCAQCHDHKFDPFSQREFYELFAYFNNVAENAMDGNKRDPPPVVRAPTRETIDELTALRANIASTEAQLDAPDPEIDEAQSQWQAKWSQQWGERWLVLDPESFTSTGGSTLRKLDDSSILAEGENPAKDVYEIVARTEKTNLRMIRLEALTHESLPHSGPGRAANANLVLSEIEVEAVSLADPQLRQTIKLVAASADHEQMNGPYLVAYAIDGVVDNTNGWAVEGFNKREKRTAIFASDEPFGFESGTQLHITLRFETHFTQHAIGRVRLAVSDDDELYAGLAPSAFTDWHVVGPFGANDGRQAHDLPFGPEQQLDAIDVTSSFKDGELTWTEKPDFVDGKIHKLTGTNCATYLYRRIESPTNRQMELSLGSDDAIKVWLNGRIVHDNYVPRGVAADQDRITIDLDAGTNHLLMKIVNIGGEYGFYFRNAREGGGGEFLRIVDLLAAEQSDLSADQHTIIRRYYRQRHSAPLKVVYNRLETLRADEDTLVRTLPITLVMKEREQRRPTFVLYRGEYDQPRDQVQPGVPAALPPLPEDATTDRLALAQWLVDPQHPLTARVTVNRIWQQVFGVGIVKTAEDFGSQGQWPSHPELLDFLARQLADGDWDVKQFFKLIVTSATYRQSSTITDQLRERDPENRLLARGPRFRLEAEVIRDQALAAAGLLKHQIGGPSVRPYQPGGLWKAVAYPDSNTNTFMADTGDAQYRRSMYTYWKRTSPPPNMTAFDAPSRETCTVRRPRTNTPLQALVLLNDPQFVEAARALAQRVMLEEPNADARTTRAFKIIVARTPTSEEQRVLDELYEMQLERFAGNPTAATELISVGSSPRDESLDSAAHAALTNVAAAILSLDEAVTKR